MNKAIGPKAVRELLDADSSLSRLRRAVADHQDTGDLLALLPPAMASRLTLVRGEHQLDVLADNNAVAQLARFHAPTLENYTGLAVRIRVCPQPGPARESDRPAPTLPAEGADSLRQAADGIKDEELAGALRRLADRAEE